MRSAHRNFSIFQAAALAVLLSGLLFSNGEGIRLLPFPAPDRSAGGSTNLRAGFDADYQENITRFEKRQSAFAFQKHNKHATADSAGSDPSELNHTITTGSLDDTSVYGAGCLIAGRMFASDLNSRPPPQA